MTHVCQVGRAAGLGAVHIFGANTKVITQCEHTKACSAVAEKRIYVAHRQPGICECAHCHFCVNIPNGVRGKITTWVFVDTRDICRTSNTHRLRAPRLH